jgi:hypothetical protein
MSPRSIRRAAERKARKKARRAEKRLLAVETTGPAAAPLPRLNDPALQDEPANLNEAKAQARTFVSQAPQPTRAEVNRANSLHSTGPRTPTGKLASSRNSLKHGLASGQLIIPGEDPAEFDSLLQSLLDEHQPANTIEEMLIHEMAQSFWLTQRALRLQNECFTSEGVDEKRLALFLRYQTTHERAFHRALSTLLKLRRTRERQEPVATHGFVSQPSAVEGHQPGFVSQNHPPNTSQGHFVSQNAAT